jgi:ABC-type sugar transport system ATPase subunit
MRCEQLPLAKQQLVAIVRALVSKPDLVILDESTSALDVADRNQLFEYLRERREQGQSVIFISHRIDELQGLVDVLTVIRDGKSVETLNGQAASVNEVLHLMSGSERSDAAAKRVDEPTTTARVTLGSAILRTENMVVTSSQEPINFELHESEIVGLAGLEGHGQESFLEALAGIVRPSAGYVVAIEANEATQLSSLRQAYAQHVVYVPRDRKTEGLFLKLSILDNFALPLYSGVVRRGEMRRLLNEFTQKLSIRFDNASQEVRSLSGGNQQKVVLSRWLATRPRVLLLNDPTRGVDIPTKRDLYRIFVEQAHVGVGVVLLSTDLEELIELCDRVMVFREGRVFSELHRQQLTREHLIAAMFGKAV